MIARSYLYVPGNNMAMLSKADSRGADAIIVDFEDSVSQSEKQSARENFSQWVGSNQISSQIWVRINADDLDSDLLACDREGVAGIVVPKASIENVEYISSKIKIVKQLSALIESADSVLSAREIAKIQKVQFLQIGQLDLRAELGLGFEESSPPLDFALANLVLASAAAGIEQPIAPMHSDVTDEIGLGNSCKKFRNAGFFGRTAIHPAQVARINLEFSTSAEDLAKALSILEKIGSSSGVALDESGKMIDEASAKIARRIISRAHLRNDHS